MPEPPRPLTADAAAARLGVARATLYAYVSRGLIRAVPDAADPRRSLYDAADVAALRERQARGRARHEVAAATLDFGEPVLRSALTRIEGGRLSYRGADAIALAEHATLEQAAALLWATPEPGVPEIAGAAPDAAAPFDRCLRAMAAEAARPDWALHPPQVAAGAARLLGVLTHAAAGFPCPAGPALHARLAAAWGLGPAEADILRRALVLCADHELNASAYAARVVASTGASLAACVLAGLGALSGPRHGGMTPRVLALAREAEVAADPARAFSARLARGEELPGFGHRLYPNGDPRAAALLAACPPGPVFAGMIAAARDLAGLHPTLDVALALLEQDLPLPPGGGLAVFAVGRAVGWIAHALEQRADGRLIRPRAAYAPASATPPPPAPLPDDGAAGASSGRRGR